MASLDELKELREHLEATGVADGLVDLETVDQIIAQRETGMALRMAAQFGHFPSENLLIRAANMLDPEGASDD